MSKQNMTYKVTKKYDSGRQWTDTLVGKTALRKYEDILEPLMADNRKALVSIEKTALGRIEDNIEKKEKFNDQAIRNAKDKDRSKMKTVLNEDY